MESRKKKKKYKIDMMMEHIKVNLFILSVILSIYRTYAYVIYIVSFNFLSGIPFSTHNDGNLQSYIHTILKSINFLILVLLV